MARQRYSITKDDLSYAAKYVASRLQENDYWLSPAGNQSEAVEGFQQARGDYVALNSWCETWLSTEQWTTLKNAVRAARKRGRDHAGQNDPPVHVTLSREAWKIVSDLSKRDRVTLSEWLISRHRDEWLSSEG